MQYHSDTSRAMPRTYLIQILVSQMGGGGIFEMAGTRRIHQETTTTRGRETVQNKGNIV